MPVVIRVDHDVNRRLDPGADVRRLPEAVEAAVAVLRAGGLVAMPTETVYGLAARALDPEAVARIFAAKGRPGHHPLIAHVLDETQARGLARRWTAPASRLAGAFWPGPLTLVVDRAASVPVVVAGGGDTVAVRAPAHPVARALIAALGEPVAAPSANRYQGLSPTTAAHVVAQLGERVDLVLDAGACDAGIESTVVDARVEAAPIVLRPGALAAAALRAHAPDLVVPVSPAAARPDAPRASPGMDARHYAPRARLVLAPTADAARRKADELRSRAAGTVGLVLRDGGRLERRGSGAGGAACSEEGASERDLHVRVLPADAAGYGQRLYATLHELDDRGVAHVVVESPPEEEAWWAIADRLGRAAAREEP
ncbi:MAG: threonylcarbamoyl-AMP synthase [Myxococcales bacterium]|nr:threonylcarbamoyl-AMP synthase [Myxococcales bacterium]